MKKLLLFKSNDQGMLAFRLYKKHRARNKGEIRVTELLEEFISNKIEINGKWNMSVVNTCVYWFERDFTGNVDTGRIDASAVESDKVHALGYWNRQELDLVVAHYEKHHLSASNKAKIKLIDIFNDCQSVLPVNRRKNITAKNASIKIAHWKRIVAGKKIREVWANKEIALPCNRTTITDLLADMIEREIKHAKELRFARAFSGIA